MQPLAAHPFAAVLFDLDGVIVDTTELHYRVWEEFTRARGYVPTREALLATNGVRAGVTVRAWLGASLSEEEVAALVHERESHFNRLLATAPVSEVPGVGAFLAALRQAGIPWAVATSAVPMNAELALSRVGLADMFPVRVTAEDVTQGKPHPEVYLKAAAALGVPASRCVVFEDSVSGVRSAKAAGAKCVGLTTSFPSEALLREGVDWLAPDFRSLPAELRP